MSKLWLWGNNGSGTLGDNATDDKSSPVQTVCGGENWYKVAAGYDMTLALKNDGTMWSWGKASQGALGLGDSDDRSSPCQIGTETDWADIAASNYWWGACAAIKVDGSLWLWGYNNEGGLGDETTENKSSPVQTVCATYDWSKVALSYDHTAAIKKDGTLWVWGNNSYGELGDGTAAGKSSPIQTIAGGTDWAQVSCNKYFTGAIKTDGTLWMWGYAEFGRLGNNDDNTNMSSPIQTICGGTNWSKISLGDRHAGAIKTDGTLWMWGRNNRGQLGTDDALNRSSPVQTVLGGNNWSQISCSYRLTAAMKTDGSLWVWGAGGDGQIGNNDSINVSVPTQTVVGGKGWTFVSAGYYGVAAFGTGTGYDNYQIRLTPTNRNEGTEGYMDEWIVDGKSLQRFGYIELTDGIQKRKVYEGKDGDFITNESQKLTDLRNQGHQFIIEN